MCAIQLNPSRFLATYRTTRLATDHIYPVETIILAEGS